MNIRKLALIPAAVAIGLYAASYTLAGPDKQGGDEPAPEHDGGDGHTGNDGGKNGGDDGHDNGNDNGGKNGGDDDNGHDNGNGNGGKNGGDDDNGNGGNGNGGGNGGGKNGGDHPGPEPRGGHFKMKVTIDGSRGGSSSFRQRKIRCIINGQIIRVYDRKDCYDLQMGGGYSHGGHAQEEVVVVRKKLVRRAAKRQVTIVDDGGYGIDGGYTYQQPRVIRYYNPASRAAIMQAEKRHRKVVMSAHASGYAHGGGYTTYQVVEQPVVIKKRKKRRVVVQQPIYHYDTGVVVHTGPMLDKNGGY